MERQKSLHRSAHAIWINLTSYQLQRPGLRPGLGGRVHIQQLGYNVWLDEKNRDKTKASWTEDALAAISDLDCLLVVFYVSQYS